MIINETNSTSVQPGSQYEIKVEKVDIGLLREHPENTYEIDAASIENLAANIKAVGRLIELPLVRRVDDGGLQIISGHRRIRALKELARTDKSWATQEVRIAEGMSDAEALFILHSANLFRPVSQKERVKKVEEMEAEVANLREQHPEWRGVRTMDIISSLLGVSDTTLKRAKRFAEKLIPELWELKNDGLMGKEVAMQLTYQDEEYQKAFAAEVARREPKTKREMVAVWRDFSSDPDDMVGELEKCLSALDLAVLKVRDYLKAHGIESINLDVERMERVENHLDDVIQFAMELSEE